MGMGKTIWRGGGTRGLQSCFLIVGHFKLQFAIVNDKTENKKKKKKNLAQLAKQLQRIKGFSVNRRRRHIVSDDRPLDVTQGGGGGSVKKM